MRPSNSIATCHERVPGGQFCSSPDRSSGYVRPKTIISLALVGFAAGIPTLSLHLEKKRRREQRRYLCNGACSTQVFARFRAAEQAAGGYRSSDFCCLKGTAGYRTKLLVELPHSIGHPTFFLLSALMRFTQNRRAEARQRRINHV